jgi:hypothetical protein
VEALEAGPVGRIVLSRPAVEAGESIGFLPGDMEDKLAPYLRPLYDALSDRLSMKRVRALMAEGLIEIAPVGYMRGRTLNNAFVVIDEAQNCTYVQLKMLLTRLGWHSTMIVTGDPNQSDLLPGISGLADVADRLERLSDVRWCGWRSRTSSATRWSPACWACCSRAATPSRRRLWSVVVDLAPWSLRGCGCGDRPNRPSTARLSSSRAADCKKQSENESAIACIRGGSAELAPAALSISVVENQRATAVFAILDSVASAWRAGRTSRWRGARVRADVKDRPELHRRCVCFGRRSLFRLSSGRSAAESRDPPAVGRPTARGTRRPGGSGSARCAARDDGGWSGGARARSTGTTCSTTSPRQR